MNEGDTNMPVPAAAPGVPMVGTAFTAAMPTALALYLDDTLYERVSAIALRMSKANGITPKHLLSAPEACFAVVSRAITWRLDPFAVAMATYQTPGGQIGFEGKLVHAIIENSGKLDPSSGGVRYEHYGDWSKVQGKFQIRESPKTDGEGKPKKYAAATWTDDDARAGKPADQKTYPLAQSCGVRVICQVRGESKPRIFDFDLIQAQPRNSTLWATDPMTQICYTAVRRFASAVVPSLIMGVPFDPTDNFSGPIDITNEAGPADVITMPRSRETTDQPDSANAETESPQHETKEPVAETESPQHETKEPVAETKPAVAETPKPAAQAKAAAPAGDLAGGADMKTKASEAQKNMIINIAKRNGLTVAELDERLIERFTMGIDELPLGLVSETMVFVKALKSAA